MTFAAPISPQARDIGNLIQPQIDLARHREQGPGVMARGESVTVYDDWEQAHRAAAAGLWCASPGFANESRARVAFEPTRRLRCCPLPHRTTNKPTIEFVANKPSRRSFAAELNVGVLMHRHARRNGLIAPMIDDPIALSPPLIITELEIDEVADRLARALADTWAEVAEETAVANGGHQNLRQASTDPDNKGRL